jgi:mannosyltransferase
MKSGDTGSRSRLLLALILLLGAFLRFYDLGKKDIWFDESLSLLRGMLGVRSIITDAFGQFAPDPHPFFYPLFMHFWMKIGASDAFVRIPSVVAGIGAIYLAYLLACRLFGRDTALLSAFLCALCPFMVAYSQEARMYSFHLLFTLASFYFLLNMLDEERRDKAGFFFWAYAVSTLLNMFTHYFAYFYIAFQNLYFLSYRKEHGLLKRWFFLQGGLFLFFLMQVPLMLSQREAITVLRLNEWNPKPNLQSVLIMYLNWHFTFLQLHGNILYPWLQKTWAIILITCLMIFGIWQAFRRTAHGWFMAGWVALPMAIAALLSFRQGLYVDRYFYGIIPALLIFVALGIRSLPRRWSRALAIGLLAVIYASSLGLYYGKYNIPQFRAVSLVSLKGLKDMRGPSAYLKQNAVEGDLILIDEHFIYFPLFYYSFAIKDRIRYASPQFPLDIDSIARARRILLVHSVPPLPWLKDPYWTAGPVHEGLIAIIQRYGVEKSVVHFSGIDLYIFDCHAKK